MTMLEAIIREFPVTDFSKDFKNMSNNRSTYTKEEVDNLIAEALAEARRIDELSLTKKCNQKGLINDNLVEFSESYYSKKS